MKWLKVLKSSPWLIGITAAAIIAVLGVTIFSLAYAGKVYPGVQVDGLYLGGLSRGEALQRLHEQAKMYAAEQIPVQYEHTTLRVPVGAIGAHYSDDGITEAFNYGRHGAITGQIDQRVRAFFGATTTVTKYTYDSSRLTPFLAQADEDVTQPVANAQLSFGDSGVTVTPSHPGHRLDWGRLTADFDRQLATMNAERIKAAVYIITPSIDEDTLKGAKTRAEAYVAAPLTVKAADTEQTIDQSTILRWIDVTAVAGRTELVLDPLKSFYSPPAPSNVNLVLNPAKVGAYVATLAASVDLPAKNAVLAIQDGKAVVAQPSQDGRALDQKKAIHELSAALARDASSRNVTLATSATPAEISDKTLASLGINELISEGQTFFPGSSADRMTNVRVGAARYNGVVVKPGQVFSFGQILGDVGPAQGYVPELVILGDHEEKQYGGGLCQVASTAYRAALLAGVPILERVNHAFAVSYYTAPYGVPGVDATIYYPQVDFRFKNDTGHYIFIQTKMEGTTLTFDYYGTKIKTGEIRGPQFVSGSTDSKQPSHTVFWRDVKDLSGKVVKTDQVDTYYKPSTDFPINKQLD